MYQLATKKKVFYDDLGYAAAVTAKLAEDGIPCVLWGTLQFHLWQRNVFVEDRSFQFIVPDGSLEKAGRELSTLPDLVFCPGDDPGKEKECKPFEPLPSFHLHVKGLPDNVHVRLYKQSETIWFLPPIEETLGPCQYHPNQKLPEQFLRGTDTLLPISSVMQRDPDGVEREFTTGRYVSPEGDIVVALQPHVMVEAYLRCHLRDETKFSQWPPYFPFDRTGSHPRWLEDMQHENLIDAEKLDPIFRPYWIKFCRRGRPTTGYEFGDMMDGLREDLGFPPYDRHAAPEHLKHLCPQQ